MKDIVVGIIGSGNIGVVHGRIYNDLNNVRLKAIADINPEALQAAAKELGAADTYTDYRKMLADPEIDAVSIVTPDFMHREFVVAAAQAGKHILVEKPLATTLSDAKAMAQVVKKNNVKLMVNYNARWKSSYWGVKKAIAEGKIGKVVSANARKDDTIFVATQLLKWADKSSPAMFLSTHDIDAVKWFIDKKAVEVYATGQKVVLSAKGVDTYDVIQAIVKFEDGFTATFQSSWIYPSKGFPSLVDSLIQIIGSEGTLMIDRTRQDVEMCLADGYKYMPKGEVFGKNRGEFRLAIEYFIECLVEDKQPISDVENGCEIVEIVEAIHNSIETGKAVKLPLV